MATQTTALGFGCSALVGGRTSAESMALLEAAFDSGIRHFDVARVYGTGDAEAILGRFAARHRDEITIATKFGIYPPPHTPSVAVVKSVLRPILRRSRKLVSLARRHAGHVTRGGNFTPEDARASLATSLERLGTTYVDVLLLHDCLAADWLEDGLRAALDDLVQQGRTRSYGTATSFVETRTIFESPRPKPKIAQFESDICTRNIDQVAIQLGSSAAITYRCLSSALSKIAGRLGVDESLAGNWQRTLDADLSSPGQVAALLLCHAVMTNPGGITLFSAGTPERIRENAAAVLGSAYERDQLEEFGRLVARLGPRRLA